MIPQESRSAPEWLSIRELYRKRLGLSIASTAWRPIRAAFAAAGRNGDLPQKGRARSIEVSRRALRKLLTQQALSDVRPEDWLLVQTGSGQLEVQGPEGGFHVSVTYAGSICAVAVGRNRPVGIDLEPVLAVPDSDVPHHLMSADEIRLVRDEPSLFLTIWTLKEALAKERGEGLMFDLTNIDTMAYAMEEPGRLAERSDGGAAFHCRLRLAERHYALALTFGPRRD